MPYIYALFQMQLILNTASYLWPPSCFSKFGGRMSQRYSSYWADTDLKNTKAETDLLLNLL